MSLPASAVISFFVNIVVSIRATVDKSYQIMQEK